MRVNPKIKWRWEGDKVLLNTLAIMNRTAGEVLELLEETDDILEIAHQLSEKYAVPLEKLKVDVETLVTQFQKFGIVVSEERDVFVPIHSTCSENIASVFDNVLSAPVGVACMVTYNCNQRCLHCYTKSPVKIPHALHLHEWKRLLDELSQLNVFYVIFAGGEPLMHPDIVELVQYADKKNIPPAIATNAYLLKEDLIDDFAAAGIRGFLISLDGATAKTHDTFRQSKGSFDKTIAALKILLQKKIDTVVLTTITKANHHEITDIMELADTLGLRRLSLVKLRKSGRAVSHYDLQLSPFEYIALLKTVHQKEKELEKTSVLYPDLPAAFFEKSIGLDAYEELKGLGKIELCGAGIVGCVISPSGDVRPCDASGHMSVGTIKESSLQSIWRTAPLFKELREMKKEEISPCNICHLRDTCLMGCRALPSQVGEGADVYAADPLCAECFTTFMEGL